MGRPHNLTMLSYYLDSGWLETKRWLKDDSEMSEETLHKIITWLQGYMYEHDLKSSL